MKMLLHLTIAAISTLLVVVCAAVTIVYFLVYLIANLINPVPEKVIKVKYNDVIQDPALVINVHGDLLDKQMDEEYNSVKAIIAQSGHQNDLFYCSQYIDDFMIKFSCTPGYRELMEDLKIEYSALMCKVFPI